MIPNGAKLVSDYLRTHSSVTAITNRVVSITPEDQSTPWIRVTELSASNAPNLPPDYLITFMLQCDCYVGEGEGTPQARLLGRTVRAALDELRNTTLGDAVVTRVRFPSMARIPDIDFEPARERMVLNVLVTMHALVAA